MGKKIKIWFAMLCLVFCGMLSIVSVKAEETEATSSPGYEDLTLNSGWLSGVADNEIKYFRITLPMAGRLTATFQTEQNNLYFGLYDADIKNKLYETRVSGSKNRPDTEDITKDLEAGTYCVKVQTSYYYGYLWSGDYRVQAKFEPANNNETEPNDDFDSAMQLPGSNVPVTGFLSVTDEFDFYKFNLAETAKVTISHIGNGSYQLWDSDRRKIYSEQEFQPGLYYISVYRGSTGVYTLKYLAEPKIKPEETPKTDPDTSGGSTGTDSGSTGSDSGSTGSSGGSTGTDSGSTGSGSGSTGSAGNSTGSASGDSNNDLIETPKKEAVLTVSRSDLTASASGNLSPSYVSVNSDGESFTVSSENGDWLKIGKSSRLDDASRTAYFSESGKVYLFAEPNTGKNSRSGKITIAHNNGILKKTVTIKQDGVSPVLNVSASEKTANRLGEFYDKTVTVKTQKTGGFTVEVKGGDWLRVSADDTDDITEAMSKLTFKEDGTFYIIATENSDKERSAEIIITHDLDTQKTIKVYQKGTEGAYLKVDRETAYFDEPGEAISTAIRITANEDVRWNVNTTADWIKLSDSEGGSKSVSLEGKGNDLFYICVDENGTFEQRESSVKISAPGLEEQEIFVSQVENERDFKSLLEELTVTVSKKTFRTGKTSKIKFIFPDDLYASDVSKVVYSSSKKKVVTVNKNGVITAKRKGKATISVKVTLDNGLSKTFKLKVSVGKRKVSVTKK